MNRTALLVPVALLSLLLCALPTMASVGDASHLTRPGVTLISENSSSISLAFEAPPADHEEVWNQGVRYDRFSFEQDPPAGPAGWPELPSMVRYVLIPPRSGVDLVVREIKSHKISGVNPIPRQPLRPVEEGDPVQALQAPGSGEALFVDPSAIRFDGFWPAEVARLGEPAIIRGHRIVPVIINPYRYNPKTGEVEVIDDCQIELNFDTDANRVNLVENPERPRPSRAIGKLLQQVVVNPPRDDANRDMGERNGSIVYVIGSNQNWNAVRDEILPLVEWRRQQGWKAEILRVQDVGSAAAVKRELITAYNEWDTPPEMVVLCGDGDGNFVVGFFDARQNAGYPYESDHGFGCLEGNDQWPEAAVGRLAFNTTQRLRGTVAKIIQYESDPFFAEGNRAGWQKRAAVCAVDSRSGASSIDMCRWCKLLVTEHGYTDVDELYWTPQVQQPNAAQFMSGNINSGISMLAFRGWTFLGGFTFASVDQLQNGRMLPFIMLATCNTNDFAESISDQDGYYCDRFLRHPNGGAIGAVGSGGATHTAYNNLMVTGTYQNFFSYGVHQQGWAFFNGKSQVISHYAGRGDVNHPENGGEGWLTEILIFNLMGDPATDVFTDVPHRLTLNAPETIRIGESRFEATVLRDEDDSPARDATVCLYKAGAFQLAANPDEEGRVVFDLDPEWTQDGSVKLTVTGHNLHTRIVTYNLQRAEHFIGVGSFALDDDNDGASSGNNDGEANPTETLELTVQVRNAGSGRPDGAVDLTLTTDVPGLEVVSGEARLDAAPQAGEAAEVGFVVRIDGGFRSGKPAVFHLAASSGGDQWGSSLLVPVIGPRFAFESLEWDGDPLRRGAQASLYVTIRNVGEVDSPELTATLVGLTRGVGPIDAEGAYNAIAADETGRSTGTFSLSSHPFHLGGQPATLGLVLETAGGVRDTVKFTVFNAPAGANEPFGPDAYGYLCFDNSDSNWFAQPEYDWVEIDPREGGNGRNTDLSDGGAQQDESMSMDLPFEFQYYGEVYDRITISSNGWMAMGDCREIVLYRNREIPAGENAPAMIAPLWDELTIPQNSGVFTWYDEEHHRFIVQWSRLRGAGGTNNTFQVILHDPEFSASFTGDADIIFQYLDVNESGQRADGTDTPYATVGIVSPDITTGLQYTYWHELTPGAAPLEDGRAIRFTTLVEFRQGVLTGSVYDAADGLPIDDALVTTKYGFGGRTDENGLFTIPGMLIDTTYFVTVRKRFYNDSTLTDIEIRENDTTYVEFGLLHPEFTLSADHQDFEMLVDSVAERSFTLSNTGNGPLTFSSNFVFAEAEERLPRSLDLPLGERDDPDENFRVLRRWMMSDTLHDSQLQGVEYVRDHWIVAGGADEDTINYFYYLDREGGLIQQVPQPVTSRLGLRDMKFHDGYLWATNSDTALYKIDESSGQLVQYWKTPRPMTTSRCLAIDPATGDFFLGATTGDIFRYRIVDDTTMQEIRRYPNVDPRDQATNIRKSGFAWFRDDLEGYQLYIIAGMEFPPDTAAPDISIFKLNTETGDVRFVTGLRGDFPAAAGGRCGMTITPHWNNQVWALGVVIEQARTDWLAVIELAPNTSWITYEPRQSDLQSGETVPINLTISSGALELDEYRANIEYLFNAYPGRMVVPIVLTVTDTLTPPPPPPDTTIYRDPNGAPYVFELKPNYPNPFNPVTTLRFGVADVGKVKLSVYDVAGREVARLVDRTMRPGRYNLTFDATSLPAGLYLTRLESGKLTATQKMALVK